jgi:glycosyltransferase involved in cell wall biosynthesis
LKARLREATLLALPSLEDNCPMAVLEAGVARVGGVPDLIEDGRTGLLCDPQNAASMSGAVEKLLEQPSLARTLAAEANRRARERFHPLTIARRHLEIYREVLNNRS